MDRHIVQCQGRGWKYLQIQIQLQKEIQIQTILRPNQSQCVLGYRHQRSGCSKIPAFVVQLSTPATTASLHCASIVLLLCCCFCAHIAQSRGAGAAILLEPGPGVIHSLQFTRFTYFSCDHCHYKTF